MTPSTTVAGAAQLLLPPEDGLPFLRHDRAAELALVPGGLALAEGRITALEEDPSASVRIDATGCAGKEGCMGEDTGKCMTHDLWAGLNSKMIEFLDSVSLKKLVDEQLAKGVSIDEAPIKRAISSVPVVKPIKITAPNSVFALGNAFTK